MNQEDITKAHIGQYALVDSRVGPDLVIIKNVTDVRIYYNTNNSYLKVYVLAVFKNRDEAMAKYQATRLAYNQHQEVIRMSYITYTRTIKEILKEKEHAEQKLGSSP